MAKNNNDIESGVIDLSEEENPEDEEDKQQDKNEHLIRSGVK